jgi:acyl-CoA thioester hydrolase
MKYHHFPVQVYYEDTDHSGVVYYANYLKYFERARESLLGTDLLVKLWEEQQIGFAVYSVNVKYTDSAIFGDKLDIRTTFKMDSPYRAILNQDVWKENATKASIFGVVELICVDKNKRLIAFEDVMTLPSF